jgi:transposase
MRIKLSIVVSNLLGASGLRILRALAEGETDPRQLARLGDERSQCTEEQLVDALTGRVQPNHRAMLGLQLERLQLIDQQIAELNRMIAQAMKAHQEAVMRLAEVPGLGVDSAQQIIAEVVVREAIFCQLRVTGDHRDPWSASSACSEASRPCNKFRNYMNTRL